MAKTITFPENQELKEGDWVCDILTGDISKINSRISDDYPFMVHHSTSGEFISTVMRDGKQFSHHIHPRFIKCDPPKVKKKVKVYGYATFNGINSELSGLYLKDNISPKIINKARWFEAEIEIEVDA